MPDEKVNVSSSHFYSPIYHDSIFLFLCLNPKFTDKGEKQFGIFDILSLSYFGSSGRYATVFTMSILGKYHNLVAVYPYAAIVVLVSTWLSFSFLAWTISRHVCPFRFPLLAGTITTILFIAGVPDPAQTFYWLAGSFTYQLGNVFLILFIALCIRRETATDGKSFRAIILLLSACLTVAAIGSMEHGIR